MSVAIDGRAWTGILIQIRDSSHGNPLGLIYAMRIKITQNNFCIKAESQAE
jgi:hypothetical protein